MTRLSLLNVNSWQLPLDLFVAVLCIRIPHLKIKDKIPKIKGRIPKIKGRIPKFKKEFLPSTHSESENIVETEQQSIRWDLSVCNYSQAVFTSLKGQTGLNVLKVWVTLSVTLPNPTKTEAPRRQNNQKHKLTDSLISPAFCVDLNEIIPLWKEPWILWSDVLAEEFVSQER